MNQEEEDLFYEEDTRVRAIQMRYGDNIPDNLNEDQIQDCLEDFNYRNANQIC